MGVVVGKILAVAVLLDGAGLRARATCLLPNL
jgi:hypothetical protein